MGWQQNPIAFGKLAVPILALDPEARRTGHDQHPLIGLLIVPLAFRRRLAGGDDALDAHPPPLDEDLRDLIDKRPRRQAACYVPRPDHS